tara:strand:+ start:2989 stop:3150 length:162 start_codon:yes stop_codon:yes gene_type:complete
VATFAEPELVVLELAVLGVVFEAELAGVGSEPPPEPPPQPIRKSVITISLGNI